MTEKSEARSAVFHANEAAVELQTMIDDAYGEETDAVEAQALRERLKRDDALAVLVAYRRERHRTKVAIDAERSYLLQKQGECDAAIDWADGQILALVTAAGGRPMDVNGYRVSIRTTQRVDTSSADVQALRELGLTRSKPATFEPNKPEIKAYLKDHPEAGGDVAGCKIEVAQHVAIS